MTHQYLLDTNIISELIKNPQGRVFQKIVEYEEASVCTSIIVACELYFGAQKRASTVLQSRVNEVLQAISVLPLQSPINRHYADIRTALEQAGTPIGPNDLLIASHARMLGLTVVTNNTREFSRVAELKVENWL